MHGNGCINDIETMKLPVIYPYLQAYVIQKSKNEQTISKEDVYGLEDSTEYLRQCLHGRVVTAFSSCF
jgi:hypothetical protein